MERRFAQLKRLSVPADEAIVWESEPGEECYLLRRGRAEVVIEQGEGGGERSLATVGPTSLLGEAALLTDEPRNATVRTLEPCDLLEAIGEDRPTRERMLERAVRERP
jgi:CRP-like cAMP-binding protein